MSYVPKIGGTLLIPSGPSHDPDRKHLFVVCSKECAGGNFVLVPISSWVNNLCDPTCKIDVGDHPFINRKSYAFYRNARVEAGYTLVEGVAKNVFIPHNDVSEQLLNRIREGVTESINTKRKIKRIFQTEHNA